MFKVLKTTAAVGQVTLPDFEREAIKVLDDARIEAQQALQAAHAQASTIRETAHTDGYAAGLAQGGEIGIEEGRRKGLEEARAAFAGKSEGLLHTLEGLCVQASDLRAGAVRTVKEEAFEILLASAEHLARRSIELDPRAVLPILEDALEFVTSHPARVFMNPDDLGDLREFAPDLLERFRGPDWELLADPALARSDVRIEHPDGRIEAGFDERLAALKRTLLGREDPSAV